MKIGMNWRDSVGVGSRVRCMFWLFIGSWTIGGNLGSMKAAFTCSLEWNSLCLQETNLGITRLDQSCTIEANVTRAIWKKKKKKNVKMLGFWGSHDFEEIHFCFIIYYFCFIGNFLEYIYIYICLHLEELLAKEWGRCKCYFFFFFWVFCIKILFLRLF